jgi:hypothetical protein
VILYLYALVDRLVDLEGLTGVAAEALSLIDAPKARVVAGRIDAVPVVGRATLEAQDRLVRALHDRTDALLPMRFGTAFDDEGAVCRAIEIIAADLPARFDQVRGKDQMTLRVLRRRDAATAKGARDVSTVKGTEYLLARAQPPPEVAPLLDATRELQQATRIERGQTPGVLATVYHLIERGDAEEYRRRVNSASRELPDLVVRLSGPSPVYAFARF